MTSNSSISAFREWFADFQFAENFKFQRQHFQGDLAGGLTSAIVALPLALAFGIAAYGGDPAGAVAGLYGAVFCGVLASLFGGTARILPEQEEYQVARTVEVDFQKGTLILRGRVKKQMTKEALSSFLGSIRGVDKVRDDELRVESPLPRE